MSANCMASDVLFAGGERVWLVDQSSVRFAEAALTSGTVTRFSAARHRENLAEFVTKIDTMLACWPVNLHTNGIKTFFYEHWIIWRDF